MLFCRLLLILVSPDILELEAPCRTSGWVSRTDLGPWCEFQGLGEQERGKGGEQSLGVESKGS